MNGVPEELEESIDVQLENLATNQQILRNDSMRHYQKIVDQGVRIDSVRRKWDKDKEKEGKKKRELEEREGVVEIRENAVSDCERMQQAHSAKTTDASTSIKSEDLADHMARVDMTDRTTSTSPTSATPSSSPNVGTSSQGFFSAGLHRLDQIKTKAKSLVSRKRVAGGKKGELEASDSAEENDDEIDFGMFGIKESHDNDDDDEHQGGVGGVGGAGGGMSFFGKRPKNPSPPSSSGNSSSSNDSGKKRCVELFSSPSLDESRPVATVVGVLAVSNRQQNNSSSSSSSSFAINQHLDNVAAVKPSLARMSIDRVAEAAAAAAAAARTYRHPDDNDNELNGGASFSSPSADLAPDQQFSSTPVDPVTLEWKVPRNGFVIPFRPEIVSFMVFALLNGAPWIRRVREGKQKGSTICPNFCCNGNEIAVSTSSSEARPFATNMKTLHTSNHHPSNRFYHLSEFLLQWE